jgi:hypothetical protein
MGKAIAFVLAVMALPVSCLGWAWHVHLDKRSKELKAGLRQKLSAIGIYCASLSQFLMLFFLLQGFHGDRQSFTEPATSPWVVGNWVALICWVFVLCVVVVGRGALKRALLVWIVTAPVAAWLVVMMGYDY